MATPAQIAANQANAQFSTGPRSGDGKQRSSRNSTQHGMCSKDLVILPGEEDEFSELLEGLSNELSPVGQIEEVVFQQIIHGAWNLRRCRRREAELMTGSIDPLLDDTNEAKLRRLDTYARRAQNEFSRAMKELKSLQTERQYRIEAQPPQPDEDIDETMRGASPLIDFQSIETRLISQRHRSNAANTRALEAQFDALAAPPRMERTKPIVPSAA